MILIAVACAVVFAAGMITAFIHRHDTVCSDGKTPVAQKGGLLGQVEIRCQNGETVTLNN